MTGSWPPSPLCHGTYLAGGWDNHLPQVTYKITMWLIVATRLLGCVREGGHLYRWSNLLLTSNRLSTCLYLTAETLDQDFEFSSGFYLYMVFWVQKPTLCLSTYFVIKYRKFIPQQCLRRQRYSFACKTHTDCIWIQVYQCIWQWVWNGWKCGTVGVYFKGDSTDFACLQII